MIIVLSTLISFVVNAFRSRAALHTENLAFRHQLAVYQRFTRRPRLKPGEISPHIGQARTGASDRLSSARRKSTRPWPVIGSLFNLMKLDMPTGVMYECCGSVPFAP